MKTFFTFLALSVAVVIIARSHNHKKNNGTPPSTYGGCWDHEDAIV